MEKSNLSIKRSISNPDVIEGKKGSDRSMKSFRSEQSLVNVHRQHANRFNGKFLLIDYNRQEKQNDLQSSNFQSKPQEKMLARLIQQDRLSNPNVTTREVKNAQEKIQKTQERRASLPRRGSFGNF